MSMNAEYNMLTWSILAAGATNCTVSSAINLGAIGITALMTAAISLFVQEPVKRTVDRIFGRKDKSRDRASAAVKECYAPLLGLLEELISDSTKKGDIQEKMYNLVMQHINNLLDHSDATSIRVALEKRADVGIDDFVKARDNFKQCYLRKAKQAGIEAVG